MVQKLKFKYHSILQDAANDNTLANDGYVIFPLLTKDVIKKLSDYYFENQPSEPNHFYSSTHSQDFSFRRKTSNFLKNSISPLLRGKLKDYEVLGGAFVVKPANGKGVLAPHQDWNIVDEEKSRSYNVWIPLVDVTPANGAVHALKGSHKKTQSYRGPGIPSPFKNIEPLVWENLIPLNMKAGEALLYDHALIHASPANSSPTIRLGIVCGIIPKGAEMQLCFPMGNRLEAYKVDENFFLEKDPLKGPEGLELIKSIPVPYSEVDQQQFNSLYLNTSYSKITRWWKNILK